MCELYPSLNMGKLKKESYYVVGVEVSMYLFFY